LRESAVICGSGALRPTSFSRLGVVHPGAIERLWRLR